MRNIASNKNPELKNEQFDNLLVNIKRLDESELRDFILSVLTESEQVYIAQRLDVMQMLLLDYSYLEIKKILKVSNTAINNAHIAVDKAGENLKKKIIKSSIIHKNPDADKEIRFDGGYDNGFVRAHYPGALK